jgi:hypothetical protein
VSDHTCLDRKGRIAKCNSGIRLLIVVISSRFSYAVHMRYRQNISYSNTDTSSLVEYEKWHKIIIRLINYIIKYKFLTYKNSFRKINVLSEGHASPIP